MTAYLACSVCHVPMERSDSYGGYVHMGRTTADILTALGCLTFGRTPQPFRVHAEQPSFDVAWWSERLGR